MHLLFNMPETRLPGVQKFFKCIADHFEDATRKREGNWRVGSHDGHAVLRASPFVSRQAHLLADVQQACNMLAKEYDACAKQARGGDQQASRSPHKCAVQHAGAAWS